MHKNRPKNNGRSKSHGRMFNARPSSSRSEKINGILPSMIAFINTFLEGVANIKDLQVRFNKFSIDEIWSFVLNHPGNFFIDPRNQFQTGQNQRSVVPVWVKTDLHLCEIHCRRGKHCAGLCGKLHLCRTFLLLGDMCCQFFKAGKDCSFGHSFDTHHNRNLLTTHELASLSEKELRTLFRRRICRSVSTMPQICIYYNGKGGKGCSNRQCKALHLCLDFVKQRCHGSSCSKNHKMSSEQVSLVLDLFAIDTSWSNDAVLEDLRAIMQRRISSGRDDVASVVSTDSHVDSDDDDKSETSLKGFAGRDDVDDSHVTKHCCSHCNELRSDVDKLMEKIKKLEGHQETLQVQVKKLEGQQENFEFQASVAKISSVAGPAEGATSQRTDKDPQPDPEQASHMHKKILEQVSQAHKQVLGQQLLPLIKEMQPMNAEKITIMLLELDYSELLQMLWSPTLRREKVMEAVAIMKKYLKESHE